MTTVLQGADEIIVAAPARMVWAILEDGSRLVEWMPLVMRTDAGREVAGAVRHCHVSFAGRSGDVVERCVEFTPHQRIMWRMESETLGFSRHFADFGFGFIIEPQRGDVTRVRTETYYRPRGIVASMLNRMMLRRKYRAVRRMALAGLKRLAEAQRAV
ncbi:MAG TPA: SRPBCC family protein [Gemmatimonadaceae bacterium]|nr:SRPBCC family protein [Gemmatimonadaceae bacterium]